MADVFSQYILKNSLDNVVSPTNDFACLFTQDEVDAARSIGFSEGLEKGTLEARTLTEHRLTCVLEKLEQRCSDIFASRLEETNTLIEILCTSLEKMFPLCQETFRTDTVKTFLSTFYQHLNERHLYQIYVHPDLAPTIQEFIANHPFMAQCFTVVSDSTVFLEDFRLVWPDGEIRKEAESFLQEMLDTLRDYITTSTPLSTSHAFSTPESMSTSSAPEMNLHHDCVLDAEQTQVIKPEGDVSL